MGSRLGSNIVSFTHYVQAVVMLTAVYSLFLVSFSLAQPPRSQHIIQGYPGGDQFGGAVRSSIPSGHNIAEQELNILEQELQLLQQKIKLQKRKLQEEDLGYGEKLDRKKRQATSGSCTTWDGVPCMFPFTYEGKTYTKCTSVDQDTLWCMTDVAGEWGYCNDISACV